MESKLVGSKVEFKGEDGFIGAAFVCDNLLYTVVVLVPSGRVVKTLVTDLIFADMDKVKWEVLP